MKRITVIMPVFNKEKYVEVSIKSILNQSLREFEFIIIDDGSVDKSGTICDKFAEKDNRIKVIHIKNSGVSNARNIGLDMAEGQYITFIDADDKIDIEYLRNLYDCIRTSKADIVISGYKKIWEESDRIEPGKMNVHGLVNMVDILPRFAEWQKESGIFGYCWAKIFPRELCKDIYFDTSLRLAEDFDFYLKLYRKIKTIYFDDAQNYLYLQEAENSSVAKNDYDIDYMAQLKINLRYKEFLEYKNVFCDSNKRILTEIISNYFYFSLFYCDMSQFKNVFQKLYSIYKEIKIEFVTENIFSKWLLFLLKNNREREIRYSIKFYRAIKKCIRI